MLENKINKLILVITLLAPTAFFVSCGKSSTPDAASATTVSSATVNNSEETCQIDPLEFYNNDPQTRRQLLCDALRENHLSHACPEAARHSLFEKKCKNYSWDSRDPNERDHRP